MLGIAMLSGWHVHAKGYARELNSLDDVKVKVIWDEIPERGQSWAHEIGAEFVPSLDDVLKREDISAVAINSPTNMHKQLMVAAAEAGKHIFTEKVMALTVKECNGITDAINKAGVKFCISLPMRTRQSNLFAKKVVDEKLIGDITLLRIRNAHNGSIANWLPPHFYDQEQCGGGAMIDLGAHPMYLSRWLMGKPVRISSMFTDYTSRAVEDNAVCTIEYENKAIAVVETGFVSTNSPFALEMHGTEGCLFVGGADGKVSLFSKTYGSPLGGWIISPQLPEALPSPIRQWISGITKGTKIHFGLEEGTQLTQLMEAAYISYNEKRIVDFNIF